MSYLGGDDQQVVEERGRDLSQLCDLHRGWNSQVNKQDVHHFAAVQHGDLRWKCYNNILHCYCSLSNIDNFLTL